jgi:hypothetical protein
MTSGAEVGLGLADRIESHSPGWLLAADAPGAKWAGVAADLFERAGEGFDLVLGEVLREVSFDPVSVVAAGAFHHVDAVFGENDQDRAPVVLWANAADEPSSSSRSTTRVKPLLL